MKNSGVQVCVKRFPICQLNGCDAQRPVPSCTCICLQKNQTHKLYSQHLLMYVTMHVYTDQLYITACSSQADVYSGTPLNGHP